MSGENDLANRKSNASGDIIEVGQEYRKKFVLQKIIPNKNAVKHNNRTCHIHDLEYYDITYNCIGISVRDLIGDRDRSFSNMLSALFRSIVELTNMQSGGIGFINFDSDIAVYIHNESDDEIIDSSRGLFLNLNMNTRKGCEKPYVTFNYGVDTGEKARRASFLMLRAFELGDEKNNPFVFPNLIFKMKSGINLEKFSVNYDLYQKSLSVTAKKMIPTYFNCDSTSNKNLSAENIGIMGCRTRVASNINGQQGAFNRGNVACATLNLVQLSYLAKRDREKFYELLDENLEDAKELLLHRFYTLISKGKFDEFYDKRYYLDSERHNAEAMLKNGTLSIGFIGLWDAVSVLYGFHLNCEKKMKKYANEAYEIVQYMRKYTDKITEKEHLNFSLLASAAEGVTGKFAQYDAQNAGKGYDVCKKGYYTNSFHVPVSVEMNYRSKIDFEGKFHKLCNGGAITYVELKEMPGKNIEAVEEIIEYAYSRDCNYMGINFPLDNCLECGYIGRIADHCPWCKSDHIRKLRRVSGYLSEDKSFTLGKRKELADRKYHTENFTKSERRI